MGSFLYVNEMLNVDLENLEDARYGFLTYKNYVVGLGYLLDLIYPDYSSLASQIKRVQLKSDCDIQKIRSLLLNSWNSELLLNFPELLPEDFLKFSNHWSPVQSYYSIYLALRAFIVAKNIGARGDHSTTLQVVASNIIKGEKLLPSPWNLLIKHEGLLNLPEDISLSSINPLEDPYGFKSDIGKLFSSSHLFLRTTHNRLINERSQEWKTKNPTRKGGVRKKLPAGMRERISQSFRLVSLFDCLYRMRIRSNYKDVDIFLLGSSEPDTKYYFEALCNITDKTLFIIESYLSQYLGETRMKEIIRDFQKADTLAITDRLKLGIIKRKEYFAKNSNV